MKLLYLPSKIWILMLAKSGWIMSKSCYFLKLKFTAMQKIWRRIGEFNDVILTWVWYDRNMYIKIFLERYQIRGTQRLQLDIRTIINQKNILFWR